jgi:hypothetical protein
MRILFIMTDPGLMKYYYQTMRCLMKAGHTLHLALFGLERQNQGKLYENLQSEFPSCFNYEIIPSRRRDLWHDLCLALSYALDYLFFLKPFFKTAERVRKRVEIRIVPSFVWLMNRCPLLNTQRGHEVLDAVLRKIDDAIPASRSMKKYIRSIQPDVLLVTPLLSHSGLQSEYVRAGRAVGVTTAHCVASWDNLTTKGALRGNPDYQILWNNIQKKEAVELHHMPLERVIVTGAQYFDEWFVRQPVRSRADFCRVVGLPPDPPILLYMCSSNFMAPNEKQFVLKWIKTLRESGVPELVEAGIIIRPYPEYVQQWKEVDFSEYGPVVVWPPDGEYPVTEETKTNFYESVFYSMGVVGVNTTAMIESAIIGKCVFSVLAPEFNESQSNTIHFSYLRQENGGMLYLANSLEEHIGHLKDILQNEESMRSQVAEFVKNFARPNGIDKPCVPSLAQAIETLKDFHAQPLRWSVQRLLLRCALYPVAVAVKLLRLITRGKKKQKKLERKQMFRSAADQGVDPLEVLRKKNAGSVK